MFASKLITFAVVLASAFAANGHVVPRDDPQTQGISSWGARPASSSTTMTTGTSSVTVRTSSSTTMTTGTPSTTPCPTTTSSPCTTTSASPGASTAAGGAIVNCDGFQPWQANLAYTSGNQVIFNNQLFAAKQWTYNNSPGTSPDQWTLNGACKQPVNNKVDCRGVATWRRGQAYSGGSNVVLNGSLWIAVQWTENNTPGDTSGTWKDLGVCM